MFLWFQGVISCRIKLFLVEFQLYFTRCLKVYVSVVLLKKYLTSNIEKNFLHSLFAILWTPWLWKENFLHNSEVYLTCINFWKFHDDLKLLDSQVDLKMWNLMSKCNFSCFWPPEKSVFELMANLKFSFSESGLKSVYIAQKPIFLFKFQAF